MKPFLDESVVAEIVFCFWTKVFLDEFFSNLDESVPNQCVLVMAAFGQTAFGQNKKCS